MQGKIQQQFSEWIESYVHTRFRRSERSQRGVWVWVSAQPMCLCVREIWEIAIRKQFVTVENDQNILTSQLEYLECFWEMGQCAEDSLRRGKDICFITNKVIYFGVRCTAVQHFSSTVHQYEHHFVKVESRALISIAITMYFMCVYCHRHCAQHFRPRDHAIIDNAQQSIVANGTSWRFVLYEQHHIDILTTKKHDLAQNHFSTSIQFYWQWQPHHCTPTI